MATPLSILLLTEDTGKNSFETAVEALKHVVSQLDPMPSLELMRISPPHEKTAQAMHWNGWKSAKEQDRWKRVDLAAAIATHLARAGEPFVVIHMDGDRRWSESESGRLSLNRQQFERILLPPIQAILRNVDRLDVLDRLLFLMPYYSIEVWAYQNAEVALPLCDRHHRNAPEVRARFEAWALDPASLDEEVNPKGLRGLGSRHNLTLLKEDFPVARAMSAKASFHANVARFQAHAVLVQAFAFAHGIPR